MTTQTADSYVKDGVHYHQFDIVIVGAGGAGMRAAIEAGPGREDRRHLEALPDPLAHRRGAGRHGRGARERRRGLVGVAHVRHRQGRRLPRRPGCRRDPRQRGDRRGHRPREHGPAVQPHARGQDRPAPLRRPHRRPRQDPGAPRLLRRRPHRPHDPADAVPELRQARHQLLQRVLRARPRHGEGCRRHAPRSPGSSRTSSRPATCTSSSPRPSSSPPAASARSTRRPPTRTPSPATASASSGARACRSRTWSSSSSTRPVSPGSASCSPKVRAARARSCATSRASASWSATPRPSRTSRRATS